MTKAAEYSIRHRQSKLDSGWARLDTLLPPESAYKAREMVEAGVASSFGHAAAVALLAYDLPTER